MYLIRTDEGLQDKAISLKSVAGGPSLHTWKVGKQTCIEPLLFSRPLSLHLEGGFDSL